jgi:hypothetical protein
VYIDEYGMDNKEDYSYGWNEKENRFYALKSGTKKGRINMIAALCKGSYLRLLLCQVIVSIMCLKVGYKLV